MPRAQSAAVNAASRGRGLTGKPVTASNLSLRGPRKEAFVRYALNAMRITVNALPKLVDLRAAMRGKHC